MKVELKHFGIPMEGLDAGPMEMVLKEGATIKDLMDHIMESSDVLTLKDFQTVSFMINGKKADYESVLHEGDKILLMRILGGG